jgi:D-alanyl-D-alanine carboxypeptidase
MFVMAAALLRALTMMKTALLVLADCSPKPAEGGETQALPATTRSAAERMLNDYVSSGKTPGVLLEVTTPQGTWSVAKGVAENLGSKPMSTGLQHRIGSITKTFTTTVALQLVAEDKLCLDDSVDKYVTGVPYGDRITVRMLGNMTSGLSEYLANPDFREALFADPQRMWTSEQLMEASYQLGQEFAPGPSSSYSNANTVLLGMVIEKVAGKSFGQVLDEKILKPHGLNQTIWPNNNQFSEDHTFGYTASFPGRDVTDSTYWSPGYGNAAGQMISTVDDLTKWVKLLGSGALLTPQLQAERLKWQRIGDNNDTWHYTFGIEENSGWLGHNGEIFGYESYAVYHPRLDASIVLALNTDKRIGAEPTINVLLRDLSRVMFPANPVEVPKVG